MKLRKSKQRSKPDQEAYGWGSPPLYHKKEKEGKGKGPRGDKQEKRRVTLTSLESQTRQPLKSSGGNTFSKRLRGGKKSRVGGWCYNEGTRE